MEFTSWFGFILMIIILLGGDLFLNRKAHVISIKEASIWSIFWIALAMLFNLYIYYTRGSADALNFFTGYLIEKSLSVDNLFIFALIFNYFHTPQHLLHKVIFWGVFGAIIMRGIFIALGIALIQKFHWIIYIFGIFLIFTGIKLVTDKNKKADFEKNFFLKFFRRFFSIADKYDGNKFFTKINNHYFATPLFIVLIAVEFTDLVFAIDSIPAILAITTDPFIVFTSNIFAILGLRSLFFALSGLLNMFTYLHYALALILVLIGVKMLISNAVPIPVAFTLITVVAILGISIIASILLPPAKKNRIKRKKEEKKKDF